MSARRIAGVDEVGRGPVAGPVVVAAVTFEPEQSIEEFSDSKTLSEKKRERLSEEILKVASDWVVVALGPKTIDQLNILESTRFAMKRAIETINADEALVDGNMKLETSYPYRSIVKGDLIHREIGAASILAKVWRDRVMKGYDALFPGYDFGKHKGYPSKAHREALEKLGPCPLHRFSYSTVSKLGKTSEQALLFKGGDQLLITKESGDYSKNPEPWIQSYRQETRDPDSLARSLG